MTGAGKAFSVGADFGVLQALSDADPADLPDVPHSGLGYPVEFPVTLAKPVIAAVNGGRPASGSCTRCTPICGSPPSTRS